MSCQKSYVDMRHFTVTKTFNLYIYFIDIIFFFLQYIKAKRLQNIKAVQYGHTLFPLYLQRKKKYNRRGRET